jgi:mono/diheme cytochrome c family protein
MISWKQPFLFFGFLLAFPAFAAGQNPAANEEARLEFFEKKIRPLLVDNCFNCHSANTNSQSGLRVDDRNGLVVGGRRGPAVVPGQPEKSLLIKAVRKIHPEVKMPPKKDLSEEQIADLTRWIKDGAAWPKPRVPAFVSRPNPEYAKLRKEHWAFQPLSDAWRVELRKQPGDGKWARDDIDRLLLAKMEATGLKPVGDADALTLIRRVTFDLTGLPPTVEEINEFVGAWDAPNAKRGAVYEKLVDRLLASPRFGEQWARHWLDLARYGESTGSARNLPYPHAWRYRDYVIDAFTKDTPYDQFIHQQIAGDLLPWKTQEQRDEYLTATGFLAIGVRDVNQRFKVRFVMDNIDEQIDAVSRSMLALTVSCARCHDHKFDPIPTTDYYALAGIFQSSDQCTALRNKMGGGGLDYYDPAKLIRLGGKIEIDPKLAEKKQEAKARLTKAQANLKNLVDNPDSVPVGPEREKKLTVARQQVKKIQAELISLDDPASQGAVAMGVREAKEIADCEIRIRGEAEKIGPTVPRGFLTAFEVPGAPKINAQQSGRLELAQWLTSEKNPLTSRVIVNRVWHHLFGQGLVLSVDNFGITGDKPSHPELLDHLATRFMKDGWSIKKLVRTIVLTHAYQLGSEIPAANVKTDPANRLVWRHNPRRLTAEEIRDAMLLASKKLDPNRPKGSPAMELKVIELSNVSPLAKGLDEAANKSVHRSIYLPLVRTIVPKSLEVFDFADQGLVTGSRDTTTVATQALYLLNAPFVRQQSQVLAQGLMKTSLDDHGRVSMAYQSTLGRPATEKEYERAARFIADYEAAARKEKTADPQGAAWASFCQALLASAEFRYIK